MLVATRFRLLVAILLLTASLSGIASETISLEEYLRRAEKSRINTIYSSDLISSRFTVTIDPTRAITVKKLAQVLKAFDLKLEEIGNGSFSIAMIEQAPEHSGTEDNVEVLDLLDWTNDISELVVTASQYRLVTQASASKSSLAATDISTRPAIGNDLTRLVNQLPGSANSSVSARPNVRGGNEDETLITFDGMTIYEPFHFNNFNNLFSIFDSRIIDSVHFHTGGFSTKYGDRLSAVMELNSTDTSEIIGTRELGIGLYNFSYLQAGGDKNENWLVNARRGTLELLASLAESDIGQPAFADLFGRYSWNTSSLGRLSLNLFWFGDDTRLNNAPDTEQANSIYNNAYLWLKSEKDLSDSLYGETIIGFTTIKNDRKGRVSKNEFVTGNLNDDREFRVFNLKQDYQYLSGSTLSRNQWMLNFGWDYRYLVARYRFDSEIHIDPLFQNLSNFDRPTFLHTSLDERGHQYAIYGSFKWSFTDQLTTELGARIDAQYYGQTTKPAQLNPRINVRYQLTRSSTLRLGWGKFSQAEGIHELKIGDGQTQFQSAQKATHFIVGLEQEISPDIDIRIEAYQKDGTQPNSYFQNLTNPLSLVPELQPDRYQVSPDHFKSEGIEISFNGSWNKVNVWGNYSYSFIKDHIDGIKTPRSWDQSQAVNIGLSSYVYGWQFALTGTFHKGWRTTPLSLGVNGVVADDRNSQRFNNFSSWDIKFNRTWPYGGDEFRIEMGITNLLNAKNQVGVEYKVSDGLLAASRKFSLLLAPFVDIYWRF